MSEKVKKGTENSVPEAVKAGWFRRHRLAVGITGGVAVPVAAVFLEAARLRRKHDPEAGEIITEPLGENVDYVESFDGTRIYVEELGSGPTVVLVHGWFCNTDSWHYQKKHLSANYRVLCYDQRGHRFSEIADGDPITTEMLARDLKAVLDAKAPGERVVLAGHSMGGMSILRFAHMFPEQLGDRIAGAALVDTANVPLYECLVGGTAIGIMQKPLVEPIFKWVVSHPELADRVKRAAVNVSPFLVATRYFGFGRGASLVQMEWISDMAEATSMKAACQAGLGLMGSTSEIPLDNLRNSGIPVIIWVGKNDKLTRPKVSERMHMELPGSELYVVKKTGHPSYMEEYVRFNEVFCRLVEKSL